MDKNDQPKFYDQTNEDDLPPLIMTQQSAFNYAVLRESFMPQTAIFATPVSYCFPSPSLIIAKDKVEPRHDVPKPKEEVLVKNVVEPPPPEEPVFGEQVDVAQSSEDTIVEIFDDSDETETDTEITPKKEVSEVANSLAMVQVNNKELLLLEGPKVSEQVKPTVGRKKRTKTYPDWLLENFKIEARPRINGKTVDKYYYHKVTNVKCRSTIEAEDYFRHGINPTNSKKRKRAESERVVVKFLKESYENLLRWYQMRDNLQTLFEDMMKEEELGQKSEDKDILVQNNDHELENGEKKDTEEKGEPPEDPKAKSKGIQMEGIDVVIIEDDDDDEPVPMEVTLLGCQEMTLEEKNLIEVPIGWFF